MFILFVKMFIPILHLEPLEFSTRTQSSNNSWCCPWTLLPKIQNLKITLITTRATNLMGLIKNPIGPPSIKRTQSLMHRWLLSSRQLILRCCMEKTLLITPIEGEKSSFFL